MPKSLLMRMRIEGGRFPEREKDTSENIPLMSYEQY